MNYINTNSITNAKQIKDSFNETPMEIQTKETQKQTSILNETKNYSAKHVKQLELMYESILKNQKVNTFLTCIIISISLVTLIITIVSSIK